MLLAIDAPVYFMDVIKWPPERFVEKVFQSVAVDNQSPTSIISKIDKSLFLRFLTEFHKLAISQVTLYPELEVKLQGMLTYDDPRGEHAKVLLALLHSDRHQDTRQGTK